MPSVETRKHWTPDPAFFDLLRDRASTSAMLAEVAGKNEANRLVSAKLKDIKAALQPPPPSPKTGAPAGCASRPRAFEGQVPRSVHAGRGSPFPPVPTGIICASAVGGWWRRATAIY